MPALMQTSFQCLQSLYTKPPKMAAEEVYICKNTLNRMMHHGEHANRQHIIQKSQVLTNKRYQ